MLWTAWGPKREAEAHRGSQQPVEGIANHPKTPTHPLASRARPGSACVPGTKEAARLQPDKPRRQNSSSPPPPLVPTYSCGSRASAEVPGRRSAAHGKGEELGSAGAAAPRSEERCGTGSAGRSCCCRCRRREAGRGRSAGGAREVGKRGIEERGKLAAPAAGTAAAALPRRRSGEGV